MSESLIAMFRTYGQWPMANVVRLERRHEPNDRHSKGASAESSAPFIVHIAHCAEASWAPLRVNDSNSLSLVITMIISV